MVAGRGRRARWTSALAALAGLCAAAAGCGRAQQLPAARPVPELRPPLSSRLEPAPGAAVADDVDLLLTVTSTGLLGAATLRAWGAEGALIVDAPPAAVGVGPGVPSVVPLRARFPGGRGVVYAKVVLVEGAVRAGTTAQWGPSLARAGGTVGAAALRPASAAPGVRLGQPIYDQDGTKIVPMFAPPPGR